MTASFVGNTLLQTSGSANRTITPHASTLDDDLLLVISSVGGPATITPPAGWTTILANTTTGTLASSVFARVRAPGDGSYSFAISANLFSSHLCLTVRDWDGDISDLIIGSGGTRAASGGTTNTTAPSITTTSADNLVLCIATERTTATETGISSIGNSFTEYRWVGQAGGGALETIEVAQRTVSSASVVGTTTVTYPNTQANNSIAFLLAIPPGIPVPAIGFSWLNSVETTAIRAGWSTSNITSARLVASLASDLSDPIFSDPVSPSASGWMTARVEGLSPGTFYYLGIEADGNIIADGRLQGTTMTTAPRSYTFLTGSCQFTGSNHVVFDSMRAENAEFLIHQGDIHYADTSDETVWRAAFTNSMSSARFSALVASLPMPYTWDNHDFAGQGQEADDWDNTVNPQAFIRELAGEYPGATEIYKTFVHGRVRFIQTDQWSERDPDEATETADKRCMSDEQEQWLYATLEAATEPVIVWATLWPLYRSVANGRWGSYTTQRNRIKAWLAARTEIRDRIVAIGGDSHAIMADSGANQDALGPIPTLNASPFNQTGTTFGTWDIASLDGDDSKGYYSRVTITDDPTLVTLHWEAVDDSGTVVGEWTGEFVAESTETGLAVTMFVWDGANLITPVDVFPWP